MVAGAVCFIFIFLASLVSVSAGEGAASQPIEAFTTLGINNVTHRAHSSPPTQIDVVTLAVRGDFHVLFGQQGLLTFVRHIANIRSITIVGVGADLPRIRAEVYNNTVGVPIHFVDETFFKRKYKHVLRAAYSKVFQQLIKLHIFEIGWLLPSVLIVDSDTAWSRDVQFVYAAPDLRVVYYGQHSESGACNGMDPTNWIGTLLPPRCKIVNCQNRHILHHMVFQRDVMAHLHREVTAKWNATSLWESVYLCWRYHPECRGRVSEYEAYYQFASIYYPERIIDRYLSPREIVVSSGNCTVAEMNKCRQNHVLLKGCHSHLVGQHWRGLC